MKIECTLPVYRETKGGLKSTKPASVTLSLNPEKNCCSVSSIEMQKDHNGILTADFLIPYEYDQDNQMLFISAPDYKGEKRFQAVIKRNGCEVDVRELEQRDRVEEWSGNSVSLIFNQIMNRAAEDKILTFIRSNWNEELGKSLGIEALKSTFGGVFVCRKNKNFWNVNGSTSDPKMGKTWISVLNFYTQDAYAKKEIDVAPQKSCIVSVNGNQCRKSDLVGGHVVFRANQVNPIEASGGTPPHKVVALLPICRGHNHHSNTGKMVAAVDCPGVWLDNYDGKY